MALDLTMKITADASQAKAELAKVETGLQNIEKAAKKGEPTLAEVAKQLGVNTGAAERMVQSTAKLEQTTKTLTASTEQQVYQQLRASLGMNELEQRAKALSASQTQLTNSTKAFNDSLIAGTIAITGLVAAGALELKFLYDSARLYAERSGKLALFSQSIDEVTTHWKDMQTAVGAILVGNVHDINAWTNLAHTAIDVLGNWIVTRMTQAWAVASMVIENAKKALAWIPGGGGIIEQLNQLPGQAPPIDYSRPPHPDILLRNYASKSYSTGQMGQTAVDTEAVYRELNAQRRVLDDAAATATANAIRNQQAMRDVLARGIPYQIGYTGQVPGFEARVGMPYQIPTIPYTYGYTGQVPGFQIDGGRNLLPGMPAAAQASWFQRMFGGGNRMETGLNLMSAGYNAFQGALGVWQATGHGNSAMRALGGGMQGMQAGAMFGPWGAAIGGGIGAITGLFRGLFGETQGHKDLMAANAQIKSLQGSLLSDFGSKENIAALGGGNLIAGWGSQNVEGLKAFGGEVEKFRAQANSAMNDMIRSALVAGQQIPAGMQPILETLIRQGQLTEANANLLMGLPEKGIPSFQAISEAAKELGVNVETLGAKVQNIKLTEQAEAAAAAFQTLADAGADMGQVFEQSAPKIQEMVDRAIRMGLELPESIKPWIEKMSEAGDIMVDLSQLKFAKPLEQSVEDLISKLDELIQTLGGGVTDAINKIPRNVDVEVRSRYVDPGPDGDEGANYAQGGVVYAARGWGAPRGTDTVRAWLTPGEIVLNAAQQKRVANAITGGPTVNITFSQPVLANDHTSLSIFAEFIEKATLNALASRGSRWVG